MTGLTGLWGMRMNLERYKAFNGLTNEDVISLIKPVYPKFGKAPLSMCARGTYGVVLAPQAVKVLNQAHPPKRERKDRDRVTVRLPAEVYADLLHIAKGKGWSIQRICEEYIIEGLTSGK